MIEPDRGSIDSLAVKVPNDVSIEVVNHVIASKSFKQEHNFYPNQENPQDDLITWHVRTLTCM